jgi:hypothetical protein
MFSFLLAAFVAGGTPPANPPQKGQKPLDPKERICVLNTVTGSRLSTEEICHTRAEWMQLRRDNMDAIQRGQIERGLITPH